VDKVSGEVRGKQGVGQVAPSLFFETDQMWQKIFLFNYPEFKFNLLTDNLWKFEKDYSYMWYLDLNEIIKKFALIVLK